VVTNLITEKLLLEGLFTPKLPPVATLGRGAEELYM
jgi:hypothetical protein